MSPYVPTKQNFRETKLNFCETKRNFASIFVVRNKMKFRIFLFRETSEIFTKQARLSYRFLFREILKKRKLKTLAATLSLSGMACYSTLYLFLQQHASSYISYICKEQG